MTTQAELTVQQMEELAMRLGKDKAFPFNSTAHPEGQAGD
jgi:hypothetical protein